MYVSPQLLAKLQALPNWDPEDSSKQGVIFKYLLSDAEMRPGRTNPAAIGLWLSVGFESSYINLHMMPCYVDHNWNHATAFPEAYYQQMEVIASEWQLKVRELLKEAGYGLAYLRVKDHQLFSRAQSVAAGQVAEF